MGNLGFVRPLPQLLGRMLLQLAQFGEQAGIHGPFFVNPQRISAAESLVGPHQQACTGSWCIAVMERGPFVNDTYHRLPAAILRIDTVLLEGDSFGANGRAARFDSGGNARFH